MLDAVTTFFHAWRRRQAEQQAAEWEAEKEAARHAVEEVPPWIRSDVRRVIETLIDGADSEVKDALEELHKLLEVDSELHARFFRLDVVDDAVEFLK
jgi:predicted nucleic acid-binding Zn ribbon protein